MTGRTNVFASKWSEYELYYKGGNSVMPTLDITVPTKVMFVKQGFTGSNGYYYLNIVQDSITIPLRMFSSGNDGVTDKTHYIQLEPGQQLVYHTRGGSIPNNCIAVYISKLK